MYKEEILDLYKNPMNEGDLGKVDSYTCSCGENPSCGDDTEICIEMDNGEVVSIKHQTEGCAISTAAISIATEEVKEMNKEEILDLDKDWMLEKLGVEISPMRMKCALLGLKTIQKALKED